MGSIGNIGGKILGHTGHGWDTKWDSWKMRKTPLKEEEEEEEVEREI
jgi:hypothetical protein